MSVLISMENDKINSILKMSCVVLLVSDIDLILYFYIIRGKHMNILVYCAILLNPSKS